MRKKTLAALVAVLGISSVASAQSRDAIDLYPYNFSVRAGAVFPIDSTFSRVGNTLIGLGFEYDFGRSLLAGGETYLSLDYQTAGFQGNRGSAFPIAINQRFYTGNREIGNRTYAFVGIGVTVVDVVSTDTVLSARGGVGLELGERTYAEGTLFIGDKTGGVRPNAIGLFLGYRF
jgi:hypothetical protein